MLAVIYKIKLFHQGIEDVINNMKTKWLIQSVSIYQNCQVVEYTKRFEK